MYFPFFILHGWRKRSAIQPQTIYSEFPKQKRGGVPPQSISHGSFLRIVTSQTRPVSAVQPKAPGLWELARPGSPRWPSP